MSITIGTRGSLFSATLSGPLFESGTPSRALREMVKAVEQGALILETEIRNKLKGNERNFGIFTGRLFNAIQRQAATISGDTIQAVVSPGPLKYAVVINEGRGAGKRQPPVEAIMLWLRKKGRFVSIATSLRAKGTTKADAKKSAESGLRSAAFVIARAIGKRGFASPFTSGLHFVERGTQAASARVQEVLERGRDRYVSAWNAENAGGLAGV